MFFSSLVSAVQECTRKEVVGIESVNPLASAIMLLVVCILICRSHQPEITGDIEKRIWFPTFFVSIVLLEHNDVNVFIY